MNRYPEWKEIQKSKVESVCYRHYHSGCRLTYCLEFKLDSKYLAIKAEADCCGLAWLFSEDDLTKLIGKRLVGLEEDSNYIDSALEEHFKTICGPKYVGGEYHKYNLVADDGTTYSCLLCGIHNGYYSPYFNYSLSEKPGYDPVADSAPQIQEY